MCYHWFISSHSYNVWSNSIMKFLFGHNFLSKLLLGMKSHGLEPNNWARYRTDGVNRRKDRPHLLRADTPIFLSLWFCWLPSCLPIWRMKQQPRCLPRGMGGWGTQGSTDSIKGIWATARALPASLNLFCLCHLFKAGGLVHTQGAREWAASSGPKHHQQQLYCHKRKLWL